MFSNFKDFHFLPITHFLIHAWFPAATKIFQNPFLDKKKTVAIHLPIFKVTKNRSFMRVSVSVSDILIQVESRGWRICRGVVVLGWVTERKGCIGKSRVICCQHWSSGVYSPCVYVHIHVHSCMPEHQCIHIHVTTHTLMEHAWIFLSQGNCRKKNGTLITGQMGNKNKASQDCLGDRMDSGIEQL